MWALVSKLGLGKLLVSKWYIAIIMTLIAFAVLQENNIDRYKQKLAASNIAIKELTNTKDILTGTLLRSNQQVLAESERMFKIREESAVLRGVIQEIRYSNRQAVKTIMNAPTPQTAEAAMQLLRESVALIQFNDR